MGFQGLLQKILEIFKPSIFLEFSINKILGSFKNSTDALSNGKSSIPGIKDLSFSNPRLVKLYKIFYILFY